MPDPSNSQSPASHRARRRSAAVLVTAAVAAAAVAAATGLASAKPKAKPAHPDLTTAHNAATNQNILVDSHGRTLYRLSPETTHHLLCSTSTCTHFWPPLEASSAKAKLTKGTGVKGKLGTMRRGSSFQITLDGRPLYHFFLDKAKGQAHGNGISSFGGVWHVVNAGAASGRGTTTTTSTTSTTTAMTTTSSTYSYPAP